MIIDKKTLFHILLIAVLASGIACCVKMWTGSETVENATVPKNEYIREKMVCREFLKVFIRNGIGEKD